VTQIAPAASLPHGGSRRHRAARPPVAIGSEIRMTKVAIVTGSSSGIGAASAIELSRRGWSVVVNYARSAAEAAAVVARCDDAIAVQADVGDDDACRRLVGAALDRWGQLDALVNNAGTTKFVDHADLDGLTGDDFLRIYRVNVVGPFQMSRAAAPALRATRGSIVNVSSVAAKLAIGSSVAYAASKSALETMSRSLARSLAPDVRVNVVCPGYVDTPWHHNALGTERANQVAQHYAATVPLKDYARPADVAEVLQSILDAGTDLVVLHPLYDDATQMERLVAEVLPLLRAD
jgi:3-oxoacyl-[acyl-carrier protein] reductase